MCFTKQCEGLAPCGGEAPWFSPVYPTLDLCCAELFGRRDPYYIFGSGQCFSVDEATVKPSAGSTPEPSSLPSLEQAHSKEPSSSSMPSLEHSGGPSLSSVPSSSGNLRAGAPVSAAPTPDKTSTPSVDQSDQPSGSPSDVHSNEPSSSSSPSVASSTTPSDTPSTSSPTWSPNSHGAEYVPGELTVPCDNERLARRREFQFGRNA